MRAGRVGVSTRVAEGTMKNEIVFDDRLILAGVVTGVVGALMFVGDPGDLIGGADPAEAWVGFVVATLLIGALSMAALTILVFGPLAVWLTYRNVHGMSCSETSRELATGFVVGGLFVLGVYALRGLMHWTAIGFTTENPDKAWMPVVVAAVWFVGSIGYGIFRATRNRRQRAGLKIIDLSKSRELK